MLRAYRGGQWVSTSWSEFGRQAASVARGLRAAGVNAGDRVVIVSENRPEYPLAETALMAIRAVPVPAYVTNTVADHAHILRDSGARAAIVSSALLAGRLLEAGRQAGGLDLLVVIDGPPEGAGGRPRRLPFAELLADASAEPDDIAREAAAIPTDALACLIYTSGTGGTPRGAMLAHRAILSNCAGAFEVLQQIGLRDDVYLSYLPTAHSFEHTVGLFFFPSCGVEVVYSRGVEHLASDMAAIRPTLLTVVPRILDVIRARVMAQVEREARWRRLLFAQALYLGGKRIDRRSLNLAERLVDPLLDVLVRAKVRARFGGRVRAVVSGGARLEPETGRFFLALGLRVLQGYGQTEAGPVISVNPPFGIRLETVGKPLSGVQVRIAEDGEILVKGDLVMLGYWNRPEATAQAIEHGWLHTGDIGTLDAQGYLTITDRKKDIIVLSGGEKVAPAKIEAMLMAEQEIAQAVVTGDGRTGLTALIVPADGYDDMAIAVALSRVNLRLSVHERIRKHLLVPAFTIENGLLTASHKIRRAMAVHANAAALRRLYA